DRALLHYLPRIPDERRRPESILWAEFGAAMPEILGGLMNALGRALRDVEKVSLPTLPRMADFAIWSAAAAPACGWQASDFLHASPGKPEPANDLPVEGYPILPPLREVVATGSWEGTAAELLNVLQGSVAETVTRSRAWPRSPRGLSDQLRRLAPN